MILFLFAALLSILFAYNVNRTGRYHWLIASFAVIVFIMAFQDNIAQDFSTYRLYFEEILAGQVRPSGFLQDRIAWQTIEMGWWFINKSIGSFIPSYYAVTFIVYSFICSSLYNLLKRFPRKYYWLSIFYFYFSIMTFFMSGARQSFAIAFFVYTVLFYLDKRYLLSLLFFILGCTMHNTMLFSVIFLPFLYIDRIKAKIGKKVLGTIIIVFFFISFLFGDTIRDVIISIFAQKLDENEFYSGHLSEFDSVTFSINNLLSRIFIFSFTLYAFLKTDRINSFCALCFLISQILSVIIGNGGEIGRITYYGAVFAIPLMSVIPILLKKLEYKRIFIWGLLFIVLWQFISSVLLNYQYQNYLNFKTIFF